MSALSIGYIRSPVADWFWFVLLPPLAVAVALFSDHYLTFVALASISLWITVPHHFGTWCRTYGLSEDWRRFQVRVIVGPILIISAIVFGFTYAPLTIFIITLLWDHQHSCMQQYGLGRIYDYKAKSGGPHSARLDFWLMIALYVNHLITTPLWTEIWVQQLFTWRLPVSSQFVLIVQAISYAVTGGVVAWYAVGVLDALKKGHRLNPMKYLFLASSFGLWYFCAWQTDSLLVYGIAHKIMHGVQYLVFVYWFLERKQTVTHSKPWMLPRLNVVYFVLAGISYAFIFQLLLLKPFSEFFFGLPQLSNPPPPLPADQIPPLHVGYELYAGTIVSAAALIHYYFDSFIWKIRDERNQQGL